MKTGRLHTGYPGFREPRIPEARLSRSSLLGSSVNSEATHSLPCKLLGVVLIVSAVRIFRREGTKILRDANATLRTSARNFVHLHKDSGPAPL